MKKISIGSLFLILTACSTPSKKSVDLSIRQLETIQIGDGAKKVLDLLGQPSEKRKSTAQIQDELWIYDDKNASQVASISIDRHLHSVTSVTAIPEESDAEANLDYLLEKKFLAFSFEKIPLQRCERHYLPFEVFHIDAAHGIILVSHKDTKEVESFSRVKPNYASDLIKRIKECRR
jgi:hypothetical protein